jgi:hypothetical protein
MQRDRRSSERQPASFYVDDLRSEQPERYFARDLSLAGVYLECPLGVRPETQLQLEIKLPRERDTIWAQAEVVYQRSEGLFHGCGVRFTALPSEHADRLQRWLRHAGRTDRFITHPARRSALTPA